MGLHEDFGKRFKEAMKAKDKQTLDVIQMIRSRAKKSATTEDLELDDALYQSTIESYVKQMKRAVTEYETAGGRGAEMAEQLRFEIDYLQPFLPTLMGEDEVRVIVKGLLTDHGITQPKQAGRVIGLVMKDHKGHVDPALVKRIALGLLSETSADKQTD